eukprot:898300_1
MGRKCQPYVAEAATKIILDPNLSARQALVLVGCPVFNEAIKRAVNRKKIRMDIAARNLDAKNEKKRKCDAAKVLSKATPIQMPMLLAGPSLVPPPPLDTVSVSISTNHSNLSSFSSASN